MKPNILVINLMYIGDLLFTTPLLHVLRKNYPAAHIALLADRKSAGVIKDNPNLSELIAIDKKGYHNKLKNYLGLIRDIRRRKFDLVINLHANERASAIAAFSGAKTIIGFAARGFGLYFDRLVKERTDIHQADAYLEVLKTIGITDFTNPGLEMTVAEAAVRRAAELWDQAGIKAAKVVGLNTGGSWPTKRWPAARFAELADRLLERECGVVFFGGPMDEPAVDQIKRLMNNGRSANLAVFTGRTTLPEMAALLKYCTALVSGDSGPMHIAVSQKIPVVALFGPSNPVRYAPYQQADAVITAAGCSCLACGRHECEEHDCMKTITVEMVLSKLRPYLSGSGR